MTDNSVPQTPSNDSEISAKQLFVDIKRWKNYILKNWILLLVIATMGAAAGMAFGYFAKPKYVAESTFVLEEGGESKGGALARLGLGGSSSDNLFQTDNIIWLYSSRLMLEKTLLTMVDVDGKKELLVNMFLKESGLDKKIAKEAKLKDVRFTQPYSDSLVLSQNQNAVLTSCVGVIRAGYIKTLELDKTKNIINVTVTSKDEMFSLCFTQKIVENVNRFYIDTKTKKAKIEVDALEQKADSFKRQMNRSMYQVAADVDAAPNANPNLQVLRVAPQRSKVDVEVSSTIYTELVKLLETRRMEMSKEMPLIQVIDTPVLPLSSSKIGMVKGGVLFAAVAVFLSVVVLSIKRYFESLKSKTDTGS